MCFTSKRWWNIYTKNTQWCCMVLKPIMVPTNQSTRYTWECLHCMMTMERDKLYQICSNTFLMGPPRIYKSRMFIMLFLAILHTRNHFSHFLTWQGIKYASCITCLWKFILSTMMSSNCTQVISAIIHKLFLNIYAYKWWAMPQSNMKIL